MKKTIHLIKNRSDIGAGTRGSDLGIDAMEIAAINVGSRFFKDNVFTDVPTRNETIYDTEKYVFAKHINHIYEQCEALSDIVANVLHSNEFPIVFSGDHSSAIGTISGIKSASPDKQLGVIWIDAHADIHSPYTTPSGNMHGMSLAAVLGEDNLDNLINNIDRETLNFWENLKKLGSITPKIEAKNLIYFGVRDVELPEIALMATHQIKNYTIDQVREKSVATCVKESLTSLAHCDFIYLSFDVDSIDSALISNGTGTPVHKGFTQGEVAEILNLLFDSQKVVCLEVAEVNPLLDTQGNNSAENAFSIIEDTLRRAFKN